MAAIFSSFESKFPKATRQGRSEFGERVGWHAVLLEFFFEVESVKMTT
jgi:hypothetical protein